MVGGGDGEGGGLREQHATEDEIIAKSERMAWTTPVTTRRANPPDLQHPA